MTPPPDGSRDRRIEGPTNLHVIHPLSRLLLGPALRARVSANAVSLVGFAVGLCAAAAFSGWRDPALAALGFSLALAWLVLDGLDGMVARATGTAGPVGRVLDGVCDHGSFIAIYVAVALSIGTAQGWALAVAGGAAHALQSCLYEGERARYHRRVKALPPPPATPARNPVVRGYDFLASLLDRAATRFDARMAGPDAPRLAAAYGGAAAAPMRFMVPLTADSRVLALFAACLMGDPRLFWWFEIAALTPVAIVGIAWHRRVEARLSGPSPIPDHPFPRDTGARPS